jgi:hypothetical protein
MSTAPRKPPAGGIDSASSWRQGYPEEVLRSAWTPVVPMSRPAFPHHARGGTPVLFTTPPIGVEGLPEATAS